MKLKIDNCNEHHRTQHDQLTLDTAILRELKAKRCKHKFRHRAVWSSELHCVLIGIQAITSLVFKSVFLPQFEEPLSKAKSSVASGPSQTWPKPWTWGCYLLFFFFVYFIFHLRILHYTLLDTSSNFCV